MLMLTRGLLLLHEKAQTYAQRNRSLPTVDVNGMNSFFLDSEHMTMGIRMLTDFNRQKKEQIEARKGKITYDN